MVANISPAAPPPPPTPDPRVKRSNLTFAEHDHVAYKFKVNCECSNVVANILPAAPPLPSEGQNSFFSEHGHAAHQRNRECSNMVATADRGTINMKHIKRDSGSKTCAGPPGGLR